MTFKSITTYLITIMRALLQLPQLYHHNYSMYIEVSPHDAKESCSSQVHASIQLKCANPTKTTPNSTKPVQGWQHHCPLQHSGCPQTQHNKDKEKNNIKKYPPEKLRDCPWPNVWLYYGWLVGVTTAYRCALHKFSAPNVIAFHSEHALH